MRTAINVRIVVNGKPVERADEWAADWVEPSAETMVDTMAVWSVNQSVELMDPLMAALLVDGMAVH